jgi:hypothetical protein
MAMVANDPAAAKRVGIPQSVGSEYMQADKGMKFGKGSSHSRPDLQKINKPDTRHGKNELFSKGGKTTVKHEDPKMANTSRMNKLEELGRVDAEKAKTSKGKKNLMAEKKRVVGELKYAKGGMVGASKMGAVKTAAPSRDGIAQKGKTKGKVIVMAGNKMCGGGMAKGKK